MTPKLDGYMPEPIKAEHWTNDALKASLLLEVGGDRASWWSDLGSADLRQYCSPIQDQRRLGSCVAQALAFSNELKRIQEHGRDAHRDLSTLHLYFIARARMDPPKTQLDSGTHISVACDALRKIGVCLEETWPYDPDKFKHTPPMRALREAALHKISSHHRIISSGHDRVSDVLLHLHAGNPVIYGTALNKNFFNVDRHSVVGACEGRIVGRHAMTIVGWLHDHKGGCFVIANSWGKNWGHRGFFYASPEHIMDEEAKDLWTITGGFEPWAPSP